jgi:cytochrome c-type biogenesis protein CcsB
VTTEQYATASNYLVAAATTVLAVAFVAYVAQWAAARRRADNPKSDVAGGVGTSVTVLAALLLAAGVVARGLAAERVPWGNMYEFGCAGVLVALIAYVILVRTWSIDWLGAAVTGFGTTVLGASMLVYVPAGPLVPALHSYWLVIHVLAAMIAGAAFLMGAIASALFLVKLRAESGGSAGPGFVARLPESDVIDRLAFRLNAFAFPIWTFAALIAGPIWAQYAWGRYWGWDPKEVWAFITWVVYAGYLHARATAGWKGRAAAWLALVGFACFLFNFVGVNLFVGGLHSYAK